jgi:acrylyl-CoA reductase (NADPH)
MFNAFVVDTDDGERVAEVRSLEPADLPDADTHLEVLYSSLNYKDALAITGQGKILRGDLPMVPGIDLVGRVLTSENARFAEGDRVIGTGWQLGEVVWGGYTQEARVASEKLVPLPNGLTPRQSMQIGTAGFTAMLSVMALKEHGATPADGEILVTGASGGAGSMAVALLAALGFETVASTGSDDAHDYLRALGAARIAPRSDFDQGPKRPMEKGLWAGAIDAVGGQTLATVIAQLKRRCSVAAFGNAGGFDLNTTVFPFILRGINLLGVDSNTCPNDRRETAWQRLAELLDTNVLDRMTTRTIGLADLPDASTDVLSGATRGRVVVDLSA